MLHRRFDVVLFANRYAAAGHDDIVGAGRCGQRINRRSALIGHDAQVRHIATQTPQQGHQEKPVGVVNRARRHVCGRASARHHQLVTSRKQSHARTPYHLQAVHSHPGRLTQLRRPQTGSSGQHHSTTRYVFTRAANPLASSRQGVDAHLRYRAILGLQDRAILLHQHRVGTRGQRRAREDARQRPSRQRLRGHASGNALALGQHRSRLRHIGAAQGIAVHGTVVLRWHVQGRHHILREHAAIGIQCRNALYRVERYDRSQQLRQRLVKGFERRARGHGLEVEFRHRRCGQSAL